MTLQGSRVFRLVALGISAAASLLAPSPAEAKPSPVPARELAPLTFSRFVVRLPDSTHIMVEEGLLRVQFLEDLRRRGFPAVGAESIVFDSDKSGDARFVLGGTATELQCRHIGRQRRCALGVTWELMSVATEQVTYRVHTRHAAQAADPERMVQLLIWGSFHSLLARPRFTAALAATEPAPQSIKYSPAQFARCTAQQVAMPHGAESLMRAAVVVTAGDSVGSGSFISPEGLVITAAHVVDGKRTATVQQRGGPKLDAVVVRANPATDAALLRVSGGSGYPCLALRDGTPTVGEDLFAIGSPLGEQLAFSLTRGVVSGIRESKGTSLVQTDATVNRGNSGGPLLDAQGRLVAVVSWKVVGKGVEGISFGIPIGNALESLGLVAGESSSGLTQSNGPAVAETAPVAVDDVPDPMPVLAPPSPPPAARKPRVPRGPKTRTARHVATAGWITGAVGLAGAAGTYAAYQGGGSMSTDSFEALQLANDASWVIVLAGAALLLTSEVLPRDPLPPRASPPRATAAPGFTAGVGIGRVQVGVGF